MLKIPSISSQRLMTLPVVRSVVAALFVGWVVGVSAGAAMLARDGAKIIAASPPPVVATAEPTPPPPTPRPEDPALLTALARPAFPPPPVPRGLSAYAGGPVARISAPRVRLDHAVELVHVVAGEMQAPVDGNYTVGWYPEFARPGAAQNAVFSAHETWGHMQAPFFLLNFARIGDDVFVDMADGARLRYRVISNVRYQVDHMPMQDILWPADRRPTEERITLITCGGRIVYGPDGFGEYLDRDVVVATRVG